MNEFIINVAQIEEWQTIKNIGALETVFTRAKSTIVNGENVILVRKYTDGRQEKFDELTNLEDLDKYKKSVFKYLH
jgi:hypothetical protein